MERGRERGQRRILAASKTLAVVQKLRLPEVRPAVTNENASRVEFLEIEDAQQVVRQAGR